MRVVVTGSSGFLGSALQSRLWSEGHHPLPLVRSEQPVTGEALRWNPPQNTIDAQGLEGADAVVHLAGRGIGSRRWNARHKKEVFESRVAGTSLLSRTLAELERPPSVLVSAAAVGYYGDRGDEKLTEESGSGRGFLAGVCRQWEECLRPAEAAGIRVVRLRSGLVLDPEGGVLPLVLIPFKLGLGGKLGSGRQWWSWIALQDWLGGVLHMLGHQDASGPFNFVAPGVVRNEEFTKVIGRVLRRPTVVTAPAFALKRALGSEMAHEILLSSQRAVPEQLLNSGYEFVAADLETALRDMLGRHGPGVLG